MTFKVGNRLYSLFDKELKGYITWIEKGVNAVFLFTSGEKASAYLERVRAGRPVDVSIIDKRQSKDFVDSCLHAGVTHALIDVPPEQTDIFHSYADEQIRNYALIDLRTIRARMS